MSVFARVREPENANEEALENIKDATKGILTVRTKMGLPIPETDHQLIKGNNMKLSVTIEKGEDGFFVVECPTLPGCISQGKTEHEALKNIREAILGWLDVEAEKIAEESPKKIMVCQVEV
jgi:predicted RNase H-like HicB family nuclease